MAQWTSISLHYIARLNRQPSFASSVSQRVFSPYRIGFFQNVQPERFASRQSGRFREAHEAHETPPYSDYRAYAGTRAFSEAQATIANLESGNAQALTPLVIW